MKNKNRLTDAEVQEEIQRWEEEKRKIILLKKEETDIKLIVCVLFAKI